MLSKDGARIYLTGSDVSCDTFLSDYATVAYNNTGALLWARRYNGSQGEGNFDNANGLALSPDQRRLYVTEESWGGQVTHWDYATIAYDTG